MDRDLFDFGAEGAADEAEVERPEGGEDDLALMAPVLEALKTVRDPEIPMDLVELGLIYELIVKKGGTVYVEMTLTTPACPVAASMPGLPGSSSRPGEPPGGADGKPEVKRGRFAVGEDHARQLLDHGVTQPDR